MHSQLTVDGFFFFLELHVFKALQRITTCRHLLDPSSLSKEHTEALTLHSHVSHTRASRANIAPLNSEATTSLVERSFRIPLEPKSSSSTRSIIRLGARSLLTNGVIRSCYRLQLERTVLMST